MVGVRTRIAAPSILSQSPYGARWFATDYVGVASQKPFSASRNPLTGLGGLQLNPNGGLYFPSLHRRNPLTGLGGLQHSGILTGEEPIVKVAIPLRG